MQPSVWFLMGTLLFTSVATSMLCVAIMTDHWEQVTWDRRKLDGLAVRQKNGTQVKWVLEWLLDGQVGRIIYTNDEGLRKVPERKDPVTSEDSSGQEHDEVAVFLIPMHGGIWTLCVSLTEEQRQLLQKVGFTQIRCMNYLDSEITKGEEGRTDWQHRMQNLSISCALVCLIILGSSAIVGSFGVLKHQISAVLVTGVMYLLAGQTSNLFLNILI
ncbi:hypothetical protein Cfor_04845 [Coptotermes formosanus]|uniref:Uncharacterized protein n=1 Tax=Coptotermes formosanus TaxID=36987 RepID=A0A6L2PH38_COPFO|nr:hypothetical protein Cfor_04845 [Coptotermes formosanus]